MSEIGLALALLSMVTLAGWLFVWACDRHGAFQCWESLAIGYGTGTGLLAWEMILYHQAGISFSALGLASPLLALAALIFLISRLSRGRPTKDEQGWKAWLRFLSCLRRITVRAQSTVSQPSKPGQLGGLDLFLMAAIGLEVLTVFFQAWIVPMEAYDAVANWGLKAKAIFLARGIPTDLLQSLEYQVFHPDYPPLVPLLESYIYLGMGWAGDTGSKTLFPLFFAATLIVLYSCLQKLGYSRTTTLVCTFLLASVPYFSEHATNGYADLVVSFYFGASSLYLYVWCVKGGWVFLATSALFTGFAGLTKNEGLVLGAVQLIVLVASWVFNRQKMTRMRLMSCLATYLVLVVAIVLPWQILKTSLGLVNDIVNSETLGGGAGWENLQRIGPILYHLQTQVLGPHNWNLIWICLLVALVLRHQSLFRPPAVFMALSVGLVLAAYYSIYLLTPYSRLPFDVAWHLRTSASRLLLHILPQVTFLLALAFGEAGARTGKSSEIVRT